MAMQLPSQRSRGRRAPMAEINVTPLVDVMLVLLIIFMVTAPLLTAGVPVNLPDSRAKPLDQDQKPVQISMEANGKIHVDQDEVSPTTSCPTCCSSSRPRPKAASRRRSSCAPTRASIMAA